MLIIATLMFARILVACLIIGLAVQKIKVARRYNETGLMVVSILQIVFAFFWIAQAGLVIISMIISISNSRNRN